MSYKLGLYIAGCWLLASCAIQRTNDDIVEAASVKRIVTTLAADDMAGRATFTPGIEKAADFITDEFTKIGLQPYTPNGYRQLFEATRIKPASWQVTLDGENIPQNHVIVSSNSPGVNWNTEKDVSIQYIPAGENFAQLFRQAGTGDKDALVIVDTSYAQQFARYAQFLMDGRVDAQSGSSKPSIVYVLAAAKPESFRVSFTNTIEKLPLANLIGVLPGKSLKDEYVIFSAHYDHIGIIDPSGQDSIANGADDDASGVSAVISLASYYKKQDNNERTLLFVAFTGEELGLVGSTHFAAQLDADKVVAMVNIEMIGKEARFGPNTMYVTGYDRSNLATLMQQNLTNTGFTFHPDPYPAQNLFYRSDNASLAAAGVPAHSFSTVQIEKDSYYHTVKDEIETLDIDNIVSSIKAIALGARGLVTGQDTPSRVPKR